MERASGQHEDTLSLAIWLALMLALAIGLIVVLEGDRGARFGLGDVPLVLGASALAIAGAWGTGRRDDSTRRRLAIGGIAVVAAYVAVLVLRFWRDAMGCLFCL